MSTDTLDSLSDAELSERVAVECAGWKRGTTIEGKAAIWPPDCEPPSGRKQGKWPYGISIPPLATDANAVLALLTPSLHPDICGSATPENWSVKLYPNDGNWYRGNAPTFARAACLALLRAARAEKGAA